MPYADPEWRKQYHKEYGKRWSQANRDKASAYSRAYYRRNKKKCIEAHRNWVLRTQYGMSKEDYSDLMAAQRGVCLICGKAAKRLAIDHNHVTGEVRALLCSDCNTGLGLFRDNPKTLKAAITYLEVFNAP